MQMSVGWMVGRSVGPSVRLGTVCPDSAYQANAAWTIDGLIYLMMLINYWMMMMKKMMMMMMMMMMKKMMMKRWNFSKNHSFPFFQIFFNFLFFFIFFQFFQFSIFSLELSTALELLGWRKRICYPLKVPIWADGKVMSMEL